MGYFRPDKAGCADHPPDTAAQIDPPPLDQPLPEAAMFEELRKAAKSRSLPAHLQHLHDVFQVLVDYTLIVLQRMMPLKEYKLPRTIHDFESFTGRYTNLPATEWAQGPWTITVLSDERHSVSEVITQCIHALGITPKAAELWTEELDGIVSRA